MTFLFGADQQSGAQPRSGHVWSMPWWLRCDDCGRVEEYEEALRFDATAPGPTPKTWFRQVASDRHLCGDCRRSAATGQLHLDLWATA